MHKELNHSRVCAGTLPSGFHCRAQLISRTRPVQRRGQHPHTLDATPALGNDGPGQVCQPSLPHEVVVVHHCVGCPQPGPLLGEVVAELEKRCIFFQHAYDLHLHFVAQGLALVIDPRQ